VRLSHAARVAHGAGLANSLLAEAFASHGACRRPSRDAGLLRAGGEGRDSLH
jgi:hypothetical protein